MDYYRMTNLAKGAFGRWRHAA